MSDNEERIRHAFANWRAIQPRDVTGREDAKIEYSIYRAGFVTGERRAIDRLRAYVERHMEIKP